jgi:predicted transcriptional regulator
MKPTIARITAVITISLFVVSSIWSTCVGGGGGALEFGGQNQDPYQVPWIPRQPTDPPITKGLIVYWFPATVEEVKTSSLRASRMLTIYAAQCVSMVIVDYENSPEKALLGDLKAPIVLLATPEGTVINKVENKNGKFQVELLEKVVDAEVKSRDKAMDTALKDAKEKANAGDKAAAVKLYRSVLEQQCLFPKKAKEASKELKKMGEPVAE